MNLGGLKLCVSSTGGVRVGGKIGQTYVSTQVVKPTKGVKCPSK